MKYVAWVLGTVICLCLGCSREQASPTLVVPTIAENAPDTIFEALTANNWRSNPPGSESFRAPDYTITTFTADGTWTRQVFTDYHIPPNTGKWNLQSDAAGDWFLCRDDGQRHRVILNADGTLTLTFGRLYPDKPVEPDPRYSAKTLPELKLAPEVQQIVKRLSAQKWIRANDLDLRMEPTQVLFSSDWTYAATYRGGQCTSKGHWFATIDEINAISLAGKCDDRPGTGGDALTAEVIDESQILINHDLYVPEGMPIRRGIIWKLFGYSDVIAIRIEYDMPIRANAATKFDITFKNVSSGPVTLERFSLTDKYYDHGRGVGDTGKALTLPVEIAAVDLKDVKQSPGESHTAALTATFANAETRWVYFNALISGSTQNWDMHQAREMTIRE